MAAARQQCSRPALSPSPCGRRSDVRRLQVSRYLIRRLLIAIPSLLGISVVLFTILALAPGDPFSELATNPAIPP